MQSWGCDARNYEGINSIRARPIEVEGVKKKFGAPSQLFNFWYRCSFWLIFWPQADHGLTRLQPENELERRCQKGRKGRVNFTYKKQRFCTTIVATPAR